MNGGGLEAPAVLAIHGVARRTAGYYLLFICLGLNSAIIGPTLPALARQVGAPIGRMGWLFLAGGAGYTLGTALAGRVFDRVRGHPVLATAQLTAAAMIALFPQIPWFWALLAVLACKGFADGFVNTGVNTLLVWTHGAKVAPYMNALHFCFGVGAFLSPVLVAQVIVFDGGYRWAYRALAVFSVVAGLAAFRLPGRPRRNDGNGASGGDDRPSIRRHGPLLVVSALFLFFYVGAEVAFGGWIYTYAVGLGLAGAVGAAYLTSGFWLSFTLGRLASIPTAARLSPRRIVLVALAACVLLVAVAIVRSDSTVVLWAVALGLGFFMAPIWPTGFTLAGQSLNLTASLSAVILMGDSIGGMVLPWLVGQAMGVTGPRGLIYLVLASLVCNAAAFLVMLRLSRRGRSNASSAFSGRPQG